MLLDTDSKPEVTEVVIDGAKLELCLKLEVSCGFAEVVDGIVSPEFDEVMRECDSLAQSGRLELISYTVELVEGSVPDIAPRLEINEVVREGDSLPPIWRFELDVLRDGIIAEIGLRLEINEVVREGK